MASKSKSSRKVPPSTAISVVTSTTATSSSSSRQCVDQDYIIMLKLVESQSGPLIVQQDSSGFHWRDSSVSEGSIPSVSLLSYSFSFITIDPGSGIY